MRAKPVGLNRRQFLATAALTPVLAPLAMPRIARAATYPDRPIRVVIPYTAGGVAETVMRLVAVSMEQRLGQKLVIEAKPGAAGNIGTQEVARAEPDGYTLLVAATNNFVINQFLLQMSFDPMATLAPIARVSDVPLVLFSNPEVPAKSMKEFVAYMKSHPGEVNWGTNGAGSISHLLGEWLQTLTGTKMTFVHYKGVSGLTTDVLGGRIGATVFTFTSALQLVKTNKLKILGMSTTERSPALPDVPTVQEQGIPDFEYPSWLGYFGPPGMAPALVAKLNGELV